MLGMTGVNAFRGIVDNDLFARSYKIGAAIRVMEKLRAQIDMSNKEVALILVMHDAIAEYVDHKYGGAEEMEFTENPYDESAMAKGHEDARRIEMHEAIEK
jgi:hypothetical protein